MTQSVQRLDDHVEDQLQERQRETARERDMGGDYCHALGIFSFLFIAFRCFWQSCSADIQSRINLTDKKEEGGEGERKEREGETLLLLAQPL